MNNIEDNNQSPAKIKVIGVGGAGMNAINRMINAHLQHIEFIAVNTDEQDLKKSQAEIKIGIGKKTTRGMGAGGEPALGEQAALEDQERLKQSMLDADMIFITAGMGGGTGTGAAPIIADIAKKCGILVIGVITLPFAMEGQRRMKIANVGADRLRDSVDTLITIQNDSIFRIIDNQTSVSVAFQLIDDVLLNAIGGIADLVNTSGLVNVDFADVRSVMREKGDAIMGAGEGAGPERIKQAVNHAIHNALIEDYSIEGARAILINVCGGENLGINEWKELTEYITRFVDKEANIIVGLTLDPALEDKIRVLVIATGFAHQQKRSQKSGMKPNKSLTMPLFERRNDKSENQANVWQKSITSKPLANPHDTLPKRNAFATIGAQSDLDDPETPAFLRKKNRNND